MRSISLWVLPGKTTWSSLNSHPMFSYSSQKLGEGYGLSRSELWSINWSWVGLSLFGLKIGVTTTELFKVNTDAACALLQRRSLSSWWICVLTLFDHELSFVVGVSIWNFLSWTMMTLMLSQPSCCRVLGDRQ